MKKLVISLFLLTIGSYGLYCKAETKVQTKQVSVLITNSWNKAKENEPVVINLKNLGVSFNVKSAVVKDNDKEIPSQVDDLNGDCKSDELAFVLNISANTKKRISIVLSSEKSNKQYPQGVYVDMLLRDKVGKTGKNVPIKSLTVPGSSNVYSLLMHHGPAFESELTAFRVYFNSKQTVDLYGKFHKGLELKESEFYPSDAQLAKGFGDDVLKVLNSCGLGTIRGWNGTSITNIEPVEYLTETVQAYGPIRSVVDIINTDWKYQGSDLNMRVRYILYSGHRDCQVQVSFDDPLKNEVFATGVQKVGQPQGFTDHKGLVASWGTDWPVDDTIKYHKETVGLATMIPSHFVKSEIEDPADYLYQIAAPGKKDFNYYISFTSTKETFGYKTPKEWFDYATEWKEELTHPVSVAIINKTK